ncbi:MAG: DUF4012 domain-containing protein [Anaerolineales bacterium]|nr:DUF4012 domain-containing protein [Anaerolineales bacterium]
MQHSETNLPPVTEKSSAATRPLGRYLMLAALLFVLIWLGIKAWHIGSAVQSLLNYRLQAETMMVGGLTTLNPDELEELVLGVRGDVVALKAETAVFMPLTPYLGWVPKVGPTLVAAPHFMEMADAGTETAAFAVRGLKPGLAALQNDQLSSDARLSQLVTAIDAAKPDLNQAGLSLARVAAARAAITNADDQPAQIQSLLQLADKWLPLAQDMLAFSLVVPEMMGINGQQRYLIMAQNEDELRPTGGFLTGAGVLTVENGRIIDLNFRDSYGIDNFKKPYDDPPAPLYDFMTLELFAYRDANFWPDFPTSANKAMELYSYGRDVPPLDGAIAIDQQFLKLLLQGTGPIRIPAAETTINANNVIATLQSSWELGDEEDAATWIGQRKSFFGDFASAILQKVQGDFTSINPVAMAQSGYEALQTRRLQIYMANPNVAAVLDELNWDGRLENPSGQDFLMVVDTNMGFNKANLLMDRSWKYSVDLTSVEPTATLDITYQHTGAASDTPCFQGEVTELYKETPAYLDIANQCYWNYLRVYAPQQSTLLQAGRHPVPNDEMLNGNGWDGEMSQIEDLPNWTAFANFFRVPRSETTHVNLAYTLPASVVQQTGDANQYQLQLQKQAGTESDPVVVTISLPENAELIAFSPQSAKMEGNQVSFTLNLTTDTNISITYR